MKLEDFQTPIADAIWDRYSEDGDDFSYDMYLSHQAVEKKLALAVAALKEFDPYRVGYGNSLSHDALNASWRSAKETLSQIEEGNEQPAQGVVSVPVEPTVEMKRAGTLTLKGAADFPEWQQAECVYKAMLAARPK